MISCGEVGGEADKRKEAEPGWLRGGGRSGYTESQHKRKSPLCGERAVSILTPWLAWGWRPLIQVTACRKYTIQAPTRQVPRPTPQYSSPFSLPKSSASMGSVNFTSAPSVSYGRRRADGSWGGDLPGISPGRPGSIRRSSFGRRIAVQSFLFDCDQGANNPIAAAMEQSVLPWPSWVCWRARNRLLSRGLLPIIAGRC